MLDKRKVCLISGDRQRHREVSKFSLIRYYRGFKTFSYINRNLSKTGTVSPLFPYQLTIYRIELESERDRAGDGKVPL